MPTSTITPTEPLRDETVLPPRDSALIHDVEAFLAEHVHSAGLVADGQRVDLPDEVFQVLVRVAQAMAQGKAVTVAPVELRLTTSQAADMLGVSRQTLIRLLDDGQLPYEQPRRHRLLRLSDVLAFKERRRVEIHLTLAEMTRRAVDDGLYDDPYDTYAPTLAQVRREER